MIGAAINEFTLKNGRGSVGEFIGKRLLDIFNLFVKWVVLVVNCKYSRVWSRVCRRVVIGSKNSEQKYFTRKIMFR